MSIVGWIDFSSDERGKAKELLAALRGSGTLDKLSIGQIRDTYADIVFPGHLQHPDQGQIFYVGPAPTTLQ